MLDDNKVNVMRSYSLKLEEFKSEVLEEKPWLGLDQGIKKGIGFHRRQSASASLAKSPKSESGGKFTRQKQSP